MKNVARNIYLNLKIAIHSLYNFRFRTSLAVTGIILGTLSLITVTNISGSLEMKTEKEISSLGKNLIIVRSGLRRYARSSRIFTESTKLTIDDAKEIQKVSLFIHAIAPAANKVFPVRYRDITLTSTMVIGTEKELFAMRGLNVMDGRFYTDAEQRNLKKVVIIGSRIAEKLFGDENPLGKYVYIYRVPCKVIGIMEPRGVDLSGIDQDNIIYMPLKTFLKRLMNTTNINLIYVQSTDKKMLNPLKKMIEQLLKHRHRIKRGEKDDFTVINLKDVTLLETQAMETVRTLGFITAFVAFVISAIGILSIMILMVNERKLEIGIRRSVGSKKRDIILQFLIESSFIALMGGIIGLILGISISVTIFIVTDMPFMVSLKGMIISFIAALIVGVVSGIYPAKRATAIQPVDILRS